jgi:hypothetical protein
VCGGGRSVQQPCCIWVWIRGSGWAFAFCSKERGGGRGRGGEGGGGCFRAPAAANAPCVVRVFVVRELPNSLRIASLFFIDFSLMSSQQPTSAPLDFGPEVAPSTQAIA